MNMYPSAVEIDYSIFGEGVNSPPAKYGLPRSVKFCRSCVVSNQRPNSTVEFKNTIDENKKTVAFDDDGICDACKAANQKQNQIDWSERELALKDLCDRYRKNNGEYDCLVPGSGGKDSFFAAHKLKYEYGMNPLTTTYAPNVYTDWGWRNHRRWISAGFDNYLFTPNGLTHRFLTRLAVENLFHPFQPFIMGQKGFAPKLAAQLDIPLVFYGENEAEYGNPIEDNISSKRNSRFFTADNLSQIYLAGTSTFELMERFGLEMRDIRPYLPLDQETHSENNMEVHYLGYYLKWHPQECYYYAVQHGDFEASPERTVGTYSKYNSIDDKIDDLHYYTTYIKYGIGRATYDASQEIRNGDIERSEGVALVRRYDGEFPERFLSELFEYLSLPKEVFPVASSQFEQPLMDMDYFRNLTDRFRSPHLWKHVNGEWELRRTVWQDD